MKAKTTSYKDGYYILKNKQGVITIVEVKRGLVYIVGGLADGRTGTTLEYFQARGIEVNAVTSASVNSAVQS